MIELSNLKVYVKYKAAYHRFAMMYVDDIRIVCPTMDKEGKCRLVAEIGFYRERMSAVTGRQGALDVLTDLLEDREQAEVSAAVVSDGMRPAGHAAVRTVHEEPMGEPRRFMIRN